MAQNEISLYKSIIKAYEWAKHYALNAAGKSAVSRTDRFVREGYAIKKKDLNEVVSIKKASSYGDPFQVTIKSKGIPLTKFNAKQVLKGVKATVKKGNRQLFAHAFIADMKYSSPGVFIRGSKDRSDIYALYGAQGSQLFGSEEALDKFETEARDQFEKIFPNKLNYKLGAS